MTQILRVKPSYFVECPAVWGCQVTYVCGGYLGSGDLETSAAGGRAFGSLISDVNFNHMLTRTLKQNKVYLISVYIPMLCCLI